MRTTRIALVVGLVAALLTGCAHEVRGTAVASSTPAPLALARDGYGIVAGFDGAPAQIEIYTEPQCTHCHDLQRDYGDQLAYDIGIGALQVTYRPMTFLDDGRANGYSATVANAMFLATEVMDLSATDGTQFQRFVEQLWAHQDPGGPPFSPTELHDLAAGAGMPESVATHVASGKDAVDLAELENTNGGRLYDADPVDTGTPTVYDLKAGQKVDLGNADWLDELVGS
jgi:protein-disulfide isomerase